MVLFESSLQSEKIRILLVDEQHTQELFLGNLLGQIEALDFQLTWCRTAAKALRTVRMNHVLMSLLPIIGGAIMVKVIS